jgi:ElaB/YqjD/DUF883 family membrane-anchored ribosome-binding protein
MNENRTTTASETSDTQERAQEMAGKARETASQYAEKAQEQLDHGTDQAAGGLEQAAEKLREQTQDGGGMPAQAGTKVAEGMESAAGYLREHNTEDMLADLEHYVKAHPTTALAGAVVAGFFIGRILR